MSYYLIIDIETGTNPKAEEFIPPFDASEVKVGNLVDQEKIDKKIKQAMAIYYKTTLEKAPLSAITGRVLVVGYLQEPDTLLWQDIFEDDNEATLLTRFWENVKVCIEKRGKLVGQNIKNFDLPFLVQRSWILGVKPVNIFSSFRTATFADFVVDIRDLWRVNMFKTNSPINDVIKENSLATIAKALGLPPKTNEGKNFEKIFRENLEQALEYNKQDLVLTNEIYKILTDLEDVLYPSSSDLIKEDLLAKLIQDYDKKDPKS